MLEVEVKVRLVDAAAVAALGDRLVALGANAGVPIVEDDRFYGHPARDFATTDEALRLRNGRLLTYKGPRQPGPVKARPEYETSVADGAAVAAILDAIGFRPAARLRKTRTSYRLPDATVAVDEVAGVGHFVEVEVVAVDGDEAARDAAVATVERVLEHLQLAAAPRVNRSYLALARDAGIDTAP